MEKIVIETYCPYYNLQKQEHAKQLVKTHFSTVKLRQYNPDHPAQSFTLVRHRSEPCCLIQIVEAISFLKKLTIT